MAPNTPSDISSADSGCKRACVLLIGHIDLRSRGISQYVGFGSLSAVLCFIWERKAMRIALLRFGCLPHLHDLHLMSSHHLYHLHHLQHTYRRLPLPRDTLCLIDEVQKDVVMEQSTVIPMRRHPLCRPNLRDIQSQIALPPPPHLLHSPFSKKASRAIA